MDDVDHPLEGFHYFAVIPSKFCQGLGLLLENFLERFNRMTIFELLGEGMVEQFHPCLFLIVLQGGVEE
jgi:hypothetical protein